MGGIGKILIIMGIILIITGAVFLLVEKFNLPHLPGDIVIRKKNFVFYFPIATSIILSIILSLIFYLFFKR